MVEQPLAISAPLGLTILPPPSETPTSDAGRHAMVARITELAQAHGVTLAPGADLSDLLQAIRVSEPIPIEAFAVVAEILFAVLNTHEPQQDSGEAVP